MSNSVQYPLIMGDSYSERKAWTWSERLSMHVLFTLTVFSRSLQLSSKKSPYSAIPLIQARIQGSKAKVICQCHKRQTQRIQCFLKHSVSNEWGFPLINPLPCDILTSSKLLLLNTHSLASTLRNLDENAIDQERCQIKTLRYVTSAWIPSNPTQRYVFRHKLRKTVADLNESRTLVNAGINSPRTKFTLCSDSAIET